MCNAQPLAQTGRRTNVAELIDQGPLRIRRTRRETLRALGASAALFGMDIAPRSAHGQGDNVLTEALVLRDPDIPVTGNVDGDITIVEYFDYQCPYCRKVAPELRQVVRDDGKIRLVLKDWPIFGDVSMTAARIVLASKFQDKFLQAHEALIGLNSKLTEPRIRELLAGAGIEVERLDRDLATNAKTIDAIIARNSDQARAFGFRGTPAFIVGKFRVPGVLTMAQFGQVIADARKAAANKLR
jgi:protein-disulfide isomerase